MDHPFFSIIIPCFNSGKTIQRAINSLTEQSFNRIEIVVVDGLSTDSTMDILQEAVKKDNRIHFISEHDTGIYDAMNKGIQRAKGDWLYFLGSDDRLTDAEVLEKVFAETKTENFGVLYGHISTRKYGRYRLPFTEESMLKNNISHQAMFFHRTVFEKLGNYNTHYKTHADWEFNLRCLDQKSIPIIYIDLNIAEYSTDGASSVHEVLFFREVILPRRLNALNKMSNKGKYSISWFDEWWRFVRNAQLKSIRDLETYAPGIRIPLVVEIIVKAQSNISQAILVNGITSKVFMTKTYFRYLFSRIPN